MKLHSPIPVVIAAAAFLLASTSHSPGQTNILSPGATAVDSSANATAVSGSNSSSNAGSQSVSAPNQQIQFNDPGTVRYEGSYTVRNVPGVIAPALSTTLTETCHGSSAAGGAVSGFGITLGTTWQDSECVRRLHAREVRSMGPDYAPVAWAIMCGSDYVREAAKAVNKPCPQDMAPPPARLSAAPAPAQPAPAPAPAAQPAQPAAPVAMQPIRSEADNPAWCKSYKVNYPSHPMTKAHCA